MLSKNTIYMMQIAYSLRYLVTSFAMMSTCLLAYGQTLPPLRSFPVAPTWEQICADESPLGALGQLQALPTATTPTELLKALRQIHDGFILTNPSFTDGKNLSRLFGSGRLKDYSSEKHGDILKEMMSGSKNTLHANFAWAFSITDEYPKDKRGWMYIAPQTLPNDYGAEIVEKFLTFGIDGVDALRDSTISLPADYAASGFPRPFLTHLKGYFQYKQLIESKCYSSSLTVRLNGDGTLRDIEIEQREKRDFGR